MKPVILDSGPLVAWFCPRDIHHDWAVGVFDQLSSGMLVCEAVLTEVRHLVLTNESPSWASVRSGLSLNNPDCNTFVIPFT